MNEEMQFGSDSVSGLEILLDAECGVGDVSPVSELYLVTAPHLSQAGVCMTTVWRLSAIVMSHHLRSSESETETIV